MLFRTAVCAGVVWALLANSQTARADGYIYTGSKVGSQAFDLHSRSGKALYRWVNGDAFSTDLRQVQGIGGYYFFRETAFPHWYWALAKKPTWVWCGCDWVYLGYPVYYVHETGSGHLHVDLGYYAQRKRIGRVINAHGSEAKDYGRGDTQRNEDDHEE